MRILIFVFLVLISTPLSLSAGDYDSTAIMQKLKGSTDERIEAVNQVLANTPQADAATMFVASLNANELGLLEDAGFLFYAAQMRASFDIERFKDGKTAGGPATAFGALWNQIGEIINPAIVRDPKAYASIVAHLEKWDMTTAKNYKPGWESSGRLISESDEPALAKEIKEGQLSGMRPMAKLLQDPEYFAAFRVTQDYNLATYKEQQDPERINTKNVAEETILRIERQKGLTVLSELIMERKKK